VQAVQAQHATVFSALTEITFLLSFAKGFLKASKISTCGLNSFLPKDVIPFSRNILYPKDIIIYLICEEELFLSDNLKYFGVYHYFI
jgi:hypothetical protein